MLLLLLSDILKYLFQLTLVAISRKLLSDSRYNTMIYFAPVLVKNCITAEKIRHTQNLDRTKQYYVILCHSQASLLHQTHWARAQDPAMDRISLVSILLSNDSRQLGTYSTLVILAKFNQFSKIMQLNIPILYTIVVISIGAPLF